MELPALKVGKPRPTPVVRGGITIKTLDNVYINMEDFSGFTIGYPNDSDFTVMAMKELVDNQTATIELGRYPSEKEAKDALKKMIEHQDDIKKAEFFGREEGFYYISNVFTMPKPSKNGKADVKKEQEEKMLREKENFVVKYLLEFATLEERNQFMGKNPNNVCLYDESEIWDTIAQMPEDIFLDFYGTFKFLYDEDETSQEGK